ncbi:hypothetical protein KSP39_PZI002013 [Platanthera zijinensis]|uniref:Uncharacterized protein n=1 Tax=Platanthera zijinensis TaxID=2320716 RepID=A0AAP0BZU6_9ASPA
MLRRSLEPNPLDSPIRKEIYQGSWVRDVFLWYRTRVGRLWTTASYNLDSKFLNARIFVSGSDNTLPPAATSTGMLFRINTLLQAETMGKRTSGPVANGEKSERGNEE